MARNILVLALKFKGILSFLVVDDGMLGDFSLFVSYHILNFEKRICEKQEHRKHRDESSKSRLISVSAFEV